MQNKTASNKNSGQKEKEKKRNPVKDCYEKIKRESNYYNINGEKILLLEIDRYQKPSQIFPYCYGSIIGLKSEDGDYADCFICTEKKIKPGKILSITNKRVDGSIISFLKFSGSLLPFSRRR